MNETAIKDILWRALSDNAFRDMLMSDMDGALQDYELGEDDKSFLSEVFADSGKVGDFAAYISQVLEKRESKGWSIGSM